MRILTNIIQFITVLCIPVIVFSQSSTITSFDIKPCPGGTIIIEWSVAAEADSGLFQLERSRDSMDWQAIDIFPAKPSHSYLSSDADIKDGLAYYRVRQVQNGRQIASSDIKWIQIGNAGELFIWPNPVKNMLHVRTPFNEGSIDVISTDGKSLMKIVISNYDTDIFVSGLSKGLYFLHIRKENETMIQRFIKE